jgi:aryl carrier-like protein
MMVEKQPGGFTYRVRSAEVPTGGLDLVVEANEVERAAVADRLKIEGLDRLRIVASVRPWRRHGLHVSGTLFATVVQRCVVTLEPISNDIEETFVGTFEPAAKVRRAAARAEIAFDALETEEPPEPMLDGAADIGALAVEYLALAIDPYPRKQGVDLKQQLPEDTDLSDVPGAFDILRELK